MNEPGRELVLQGIGASGGLALGRIAIHRACQGRPRTAGSPPQEADCLRAAMARAAAEISELAARVGKDAAADILEFQIALLDDEDLTVPIFERIAAGAPADVAWRETLDAEIAAYREAGDEVLEARTSDLADLRERVLEALSPGPKDAAGSNGEDAIYAAEELTPSRFLETDWKRFRGAALKGGSAAGHVAVLARARGIPLIVGLGDAFGQLRNGAPALLDAEHGRVILDPRPTTLGRAKRRLAGQAELAARHARLLERPALTGAGERIGSDQRR